MRVDSVEDFAYGAEILVNTTDQVSLTLEQVSAPRDGSNRTRDTLNTEILPDKQKTCTQIEKV